MSHTFINYRRDDAASEAAQIAKALRDAVGIDAVFYDTSSIKAGAKWPDEIRRALLGASVVIVVVGPGWLTVGSDQWGRRRIDQADDWVRNEIEIALTESSKTVIPVLVRDAKLPPGDAIPECIADLPKLQKIDLRRDYWDHDIELLIERVCPESCDFPDSVPSVLGLTWEKMTPDLQDAFALAASAARREGKKIVSTRLLFAALKRLHSDRMDELLAQIPGDAIPDTMPAEIVADKDDIAHLDLVSSCVQHSLGHFATTAEPSLSGEEIFVDIARHGTGASVQRLRTHGIDETKINEIVRQLGWRVTARAEQGGAGQPATRTESK